MENGQILTLIRKVLFFMHRILTMNDLERIEILDSNILLLGLSEQSTHLNSYRLIEKSIISFEISSNYLVAP